MLLSSLILNSVEQKNVKCWILCGNLNFCNTIILTEPCAVVITKPCYCVNCEKINN